MTEAVRQILTQIDDLSKEERDELALHFLRSLEPEDEEIAAAWDEELVRRAELIRSGKAVGSPVEEVFARIREKLS